DWITFQPVTYSATFGWNNGPVGQIVGATVNSRVDIKGGISLRPQDLWRKFGFYRQIEDAQKRADQEKKQEREQREKERRERREQEKAARAAEKEAGQAAADSTAQTPEQQMQAQAVSDSTSLPTAPVDASPSPDTLATAAQNENAQDSGGGFRLPLPDPVSLLRRSFLAVTGMKDFTVQYTNGRSGTSNNVGRANADTTAVITPYSMLDALRGHGPSLAYRLGFDQLLGGSGRVMSNNLIVSDRLTNSNKILARTTLTPSPKLNISLNWNTDWGNQQGYTYRSARPNDFVLSQSGNNSASVWAFGAAYLPFFQSQRETFQRDRDASGDAEIIGDGDGNGRVALTNQSVIGDFRRSYVSSIGVLSGAVPQPIPMPSWQVTYTGISDWPLIRSLVNSATLKHGYSADYRTDFQTNSIQDTLTTFILGNRKIRYATPEYTIGTVRVNERYQPLIGVDLSFKGQFTTSIDWNKSNSYTLAPSSNEVRELRTNQISFTANYQRQGLQIPFLPVKRLNNRITFSLTASWETNTDTQYYLKKALESVLTNPNFTDSDVFGGDFISRPTDTHRFTISPRIAYQFSNRVSADFTLKRETFISADSRIPSYSSMNGGFNIRVSISN
ncbi:MAG TPA: cell surface protein SprA, partial [Rhodothermales bacterium]|nr:cell surface protein SprA [Rhodothermales bacterium]